MPYIPDPLERLVDKHDRVHKLMARLATTPDLAKRTRTLAKLTDALTELLAVKQDLVYPQFRSYIADRTMAEILVEHDKIKRMLANLIWLDVDDERFDVLAANLAALFESHMRWQDDELFESVSTSMTAADLATFGTRLFAWFEAYASPRDPN